MDKKELIEKYGLDLKKLESEQTKLAKQIELKDSADFSAATKIGAIENFMVKNTIISAIVVCSRGKDNLEIIEQDYFLDKLRFPYIYGFEAYRELPSMISAFSKLKEKPDIVLVRGCGANHPRLGIASHFSIAAGVPAIGVSSNLFEGNKIEKKTDISMKGRRAGKILKSKQGSNPLYICPGNRISVDSAYKMVKSMIVLPHKLPEPMHLAHKYSREIKKELGLSSPLYFF